MEFVREVSEQYLGEQRTESNVPAVKKLALWSSMDKIVSAVKMELGENGDLTREMSIFF